jgi:hypothetical protein
VPEGAVRVARVPEAVRQQIRDEIRADVMKQAADEGWVTKNQAAPEWTRRVRLYGDVRVRSESDLYARTNSRGIIDFGRMNAQGPTDLRLNVVPLLNATQDRVNRLKLRARLGLDAQLHEGITVGLRLATGDDNSPIAQNASLGNGLVKRSIWLDTAFVKLQPKSWASFTFGRFDNPFNTTELLYDNELRFDGVAAKVGFGGKDSAFSLTGGAFPLDFGNPDYPIKSSEKLNYPTKWLFAGELSWAGQPADDLSLKASVGFHSFRNVQGKLSDPCNLDQVDYCSTDGMAPVGLRKGNTVFTLRNPTASSSGISPELMGLKFKYDVLDINLSARMALDDVVGARLSGNYVRNLGFRRRDICSGLIEGLNGASVPEAALVEPYNNYGSDGNASGHICTVTNPTSFVGGNTGWLVNARLGHDLVDKQGSWSVFAEYRYLESDAVLDAFADSDFHLGGTNAKGYILGGEYGVRDGLSLGARWLSANQISGEALAIDVLQLDLKARF